MHEPPWIQVMNEDSWDVAPQMLTQLLDNDDEVGGIIIQ